MLKNSNVLLKLFVSLLMTALLITCSKNTTDPEEEEEEVTFSVKNISWSEIVDNDSDGYTQYRKLNFDVDASLGTQAVFATLFIKPANSANFTAYVTTSNFTITGSSTGDARFIGMGGSNGELTNGSYDFEIRIFKPNTSVPLVSAGVISNAVLNDQTFESASEDVSVSFSIFAASWSDYVDNDSDGYTQSRALIFDVDASSGTHNIYAQIYYKSAVSANWSLYGTTPIYSIDGSSSSDVYSVAIDPINTELFSGIYDFKIDIYEEGNVALQASRGPAEDADLDDQAFEAASEDLSLGFSIYDAFWIDPIDDDSDGYTQGRTLVFDADVSSGTHSVYAQIYYKPASSGNWILYSSTNNFSITGSGGDDLYGIFIGSDLTLDYYDFLIELYEVGNSSTVAQSGPDNDTDLNDQAFELAGEDIAAIFNVYDAWWDGVYDIDQDGYAQYRFLYFDVDVSAGTHSVYAVVWYRPASSGSWVLYTTTGAFTITGYEYDSQWVGIGGIGGELPYDTYDIWIDIYDANSGTLVATSNQDNDPDLNDQLFETAAEDGSPNFYVYDIWWTDVIDNDADQYSRYRRINIDVDVFSGTHQVIAQLYYKPANSGSWQLYYETPPYYITDGSGNDYYWIAAGSPNLELAHDQYDFFVLIYEYSTGLLSDWRFEENDSDLNDQAFELSSED